MSFAPGRSTSEFAKAMRAELAGFVVLVIGLVWGSLGAWHGAIVTGSVGFGFSLVGGYLLVGSTRAYADSRGHIKAAAVRRPAGEAPRSI